MIRMVDRTQAHGWLESCPVCFGSFLDAGEFRDLTAHSIADVFGGCARAIARSRKRRALPRGG